MRVRAGLLTLLILTLFPVDHGGAERRFVPDYLMPPPEVRAVFELVVPVRPVLIPPEGTILKEQEAYVSAESATGAFLGSYLVTAAHVTLQFLPGQHDQAQRQITGELFLWRLKVKPLKSIYINERTDIGIFSLGTHKPGQHLSLASSPPDKQELLWWICRGGLMEDEWSVGRYLDQIELPGAAGGPRYLINPILGGIHLGCSGAPVFNGAGLVVGIILSHNNAGSVLNGFVATLKELKVAMEAASTGR